MWLWRSRVRRLTFAAVPEPTDRERAALANLDPSVKRAVDLARMLDDRYVDPLVGLVLPGAGDLITASAGVYLVWVAIQRGLPAVVERRSKTRLAPRLPSGSI